MYYIISSIENSKHYKLSLSEKLDQDEFEIENIKLNRINIYWDNINFGWKLLDKKINEFLLWCDKFWGYEYQFTREAKIKFNSQKKDNRRELVVKRNEKFDSSVINEKVKLFNFQKDGVGWLISRNRSYLTDDFGLGKSAQSIAAFSYWYKKEYVDHIIILCKKGLVWHWFYEVLDFSSQFKEEDIICIDNKTKKDKIYSTYKNKKIIIIPHNLLAETFLAYKPKRKSRKIKTIRWNNSIVDLHKELNSSRLAIISDEHHKYKKMNSAKTQALDSHIDFFEYRIFMSATVAINDFTDHYSPLRMLDRSLVPDTQEEFSLLLANQIGDRFDKYKVVEFDENYVKELQEKMKFYFLKRLKDDLPEMKFKKFTNPIFFNLSNKHRRIYDIVVDSVFKNVDTSNLTVDNLYSKFIYILLTIDNPKLLYGKVDEKIDSLLDKWTLNDDSRIDYLDEYVQEQIEDYKQKIIIFDTHPLTLDFLFERYKKYNPLIHHGKLKIKGDSAKYQYEIQRLFNEENDHRLILLSSLTSSEGLNLQKGGNKVVVFTQDNDTTNFSQLQDRSHRIVSKRDTFVYFFIFRETFDYVRYRRNINREDFNKKFTSKSMSQDELKKMMQGIL